ncbi:hypothetical protein [Sphingomonas sp. BK580]|uniref:hypothetical protein n=1 Tax=Sphingomonas sp. BK580 TaxID=2586972 RepID=UPI001608602F|nr:hypothetical protein [Sphingomonas sp. BK580]MBB3692121.1 hypothetical protein [Sphingomonas sp. BK580]
MAYPFLVTAILLGASPSPSASTASTTAGHTARGLPACRPLGLAPGVVPATSVLAARANVLETGIAAARKARTLTQPQADALWQQADQVRQRVAGKVRLPVATRAEARRTLESIATRLCHR